MAYKALYRTYRPKTFSEVVGQRAIVRTLQNALKEQKIAHAYLFCGPRGTGKTTMARLFAKALNCSEGIGHECGHCENCLDILEGKHPDVYEIDAASNSGVDNVRSLIEQVGFAPILGRYKVYIIDEVHSMTGAAFNALLKTLEEPPENVVFILCTTEPDKLLPTILSRVQRFNFSKVSDEDLIFNMKRILEHEKVSYEDEALKIIARMSQGGVRDSLSLLDQAISYGGDKVTAEDVNSIFGLLKVEDEIELIRNIHLNKVTEVLDFLKEKYAKGADIIRLHDDLINLYKEILIYGTTRDPSLLTRITPEEGQSMPLRRSEILKDLDVLIKDRREYKNVSNPFDAFELTLLRLSLNAEEDDAGFTKEVKTEEKPEVKSVPAETEKEKPSEVSKPAEAPVSEPAAAPSPFIGEKPVQSPEETKPEPASAAPAEEETAGEGTVHTISTAAMEHTPVTSGAAYTPSPEVIYNIMVQGDKKLKTELYNAWDETLRSIPSFDPNAYLSAELLKVKPCVATPGCLVVKGFFAGAVKAINLYDNIKALTEIMATYFHHPDMRVIAITQSEYVDEVNGFLNLRQAGKLPDPQPIVIPDVPDGQEKKEIPEDEQKKERAQNALNFISSLGFGNNSSN